MILNTSEELATLTVLIKYTRHKYRVYVMLRKILFHLTRKCERGETFFYFQKYKNSFGVVSRRSR